MPTIITAYDAPNALEKRLAVRQAHIDYIEKLKQAGKVIIGVALTDNDKMIGSCLVTLFDSQAEVDAYLKEEPYVLNGVWEKIDTQSCAIGPSFQHLLLTQE